MAATTEASGTNQALARQAEILSRPMTENRRLADVIRALAIDAVEAAKSGHPGMPMGMADAATVLWSHFHKFDPNAPRWPDRDRFVLSAGHGSMLLYSLLHLTGYPGMTIDDLKHFRQLHSPAAGHPELGENPGIETTTGPLGQGLATSIGMALAERILAARFGKPLVDHRTWVICSDGDLMEGVSHEALGLAGHLGLSKLTVLYDDNNISIDGNTSLARTEDVVKRVTAHNWAVREVDGHDPEQVKAALSASTRSRKPTMIVCHTIIGLGAPTKAGTAATHGSPLGTAEAEGAKKLLGWTAPPFTVPEDLAAKWRAIGQRSTADRQTWEKRLAASNQRAEFERAIEGRLPDNWNDAVAALKQEIADSKPKMASRQSSQKALETLVPATPELVGGSADLTGSNLTLVKGQSAIKPGEFNGQYIHYGIREHGMAACANGMALHGGIIPYTGTFFIFTDYMRPALRLGALMRQRVIHVLTHDSIGLGEDGPTHQAVEHLASLRAMPHMHVYRPADTLETVECWELAMRRTEGPSCLVLTRQALPALRFDTAENRCARGGYVLAEAEGSRQATFLATGSEVSIAMDARAKLAEEGIHTAVVSLPCWELFEDQDADYRAGVLGTAPRIGIEAACGFGWERYLGSDGVFIGMNGFGASAPADALYKFFGITADAAAAAVHKRLGK